MKQTIEGLQVANKTVFVRVDFNVPMKDGVITDDTRIRSALPTINYLIEKGAKVILASHFGRPKGERKPEMSLAPCAKHLSELINKPVAFVDDCIGPKVEAAVKALQPGDVLMLENLRYHNEETKNDPEFAKQLASLADVAVDDAFGVSHRAHASNAGIAQYVEVVGGFLIEKEIQFIGKALSNPERPFVAIIGGAKVSDKIGVISNLLEKADAVVIGGGMANTFLAAQGKGIGSSLFEEEKLPLAKELLAKAEEKGVKMLLPIDNKLGKEFSANTETMYADRESIPDGWEGLDIGPKTIELYAEELRKAKTVIWNGTVGVAEFAAFAEGTNKLAQVLAELDATTIIGGGDTAAAIQKAGVADKMTHVSTGGGASLEFIEGKKLPGIECLLDK